MNRVLMQDLKQIHQKNKDKLRIVFDAILNDCM
jgi:hypothetical protein